MFGLLNKKNEALFRKGKLRTFYSFKSIFQKEVYLDILNKSESSISSHIFGNYLQTNKPIEMIFTSKCLFW